LRQIAVAALAVPILLSVYLIIVLRRPVARLGAVVVALAVGGLLAISGLSAPAKTTADEPVAPSPLPVAAFTPIQVREGLTAPVRLTFSTPMDEASVRAALSVDPPVPVTAAFDQGGSDVTISPVGYWVPGTFYRVTIEPNARDRTGQRLGSAVQTAFLTRPATTAHLLATGLETGTVPLDSRFIATIDGDVRPQDLRAALRITPEIAGSVEVTDLHEVSSRGDEPLWQAVFTPDQPLTAGLSYTFSLASMVDRDGAPLVEPAALTVTTASAPSVVRFRPLDRATAVPLAQTLSVRFTQPMDRPSTQAAFSATVGGTAIAGAFDWAEQGTVLVFKPAKALDYSQTVVMTVATSARSTRGVPLAAAGSATFTTIPKPTPTPAPTPKATPKPKPAATPIPSGGTAASGTWSAVEAYYLRLLNCTRTGGWVTTSGACQAGSNGTAALVMNAGLQTRVARPYAKVLATSGACSHTAGGTTFAGRLKAGGFSGYIWAGENVGCGNGDPYKAMLADHLFFQNEKSTNGGHYRNIMDPRFKWVGVGVWVYAGRCRLVTDFLDP
jgi:uncharacterized protein YkwD